MMESNAMREYKRATAELLMRRELDRISVSEEAPYMDVLESTWARMNAEEQNVIDAWVREIVSAPSAYAIESELAVVQGDPRDVPGGRIAA